MFGLNSNKNKVNDGNLILPKEFDTIEDCAGEHMVIKRGNLYGAIDACGKVVIEPEYEGVYCVDGHIFVETVCGFQIFKPGVGILPKVYESREMAIKELEKFK